MSLTPIKKLSYIPISILLSVCCCISFGQAPTITDFTPKTICQGDQVTITGTNFFAAAAVQLGNLSAKDFTVKNATTIVATVDDAATSGPVKVVTLWGTATGAGTLVVNPAPIPLLEDASPLVDIPFTNCNGNSVYDLTVLNASTNIQPNSVYDIDWNDGTPNATQTDWAPGATITHTFSYQGYFQIKLAITPANGCVKTFTQNFYNGANPLASFTTTDPTTGLCVPANVKFKIGNWFNNTTGTTYEVDFGDGSPVVDLSNPLNGTKTDQVVQHTYLKSSCPDADYTASLKASNGCFTTTYTLNQIITRQKPKPDFSFDTTCVSQPVCFANTTIDGYSGISCTTNANFVWDFGDGTTSNQKDPGCHQYTTPGIYSVKLSASNPACGGDEITKAVIIKATSPGPTGPSGEAGGYTVTYCQYEVASPLTATGTDLVWYTDATGGTGTIDAPTPSTSVPGTTVYYVTQTVSGQCESPRIAINVIVNPIPNAPVVTNVTLCKGVPATPLTATGSNLLWYTDATGGTGTTTPPTPSTANVGTTHYYVSQTVNGCEGPRATIDVNVIDKPPAPNVVTPVTYCQNQTAIPLTATGTNLLWYTDATGGTGTSIAPTPSTSVTGTTTYYVSQSNSCGEGPRAPITVNVHAGPSATISYSPSSLCNSVTATAVPVTITGDNTGSFSISPSTGLTINNTTGTLSPAGATPGTYTITYIINASGGCALFKTTTTVSISSQPIAAIQYPPICSSDSNVPVTITGATGGTFSSDAGLVIDGTTGIINASASTPGNHTVKYSIAPSPPCPGFDATTTITITKTPSASIQYNPSILCNAGSATAVDVTLAGDNGGTFSINPSTGLVINVATGKISPAGATPGTYTVTYTINASGGCTVFTTTTNVSVSSTPTATIQYPPICSSDNNVAVTINGISGGTFSSDAGLVIDGATGAIDVSASTPGNHTVQYSIAPSPPCPGFDASTTVTITKTPSASIQYNPSNLCNGATAADVDVTLTGDGGGSFTISPSTGLAINTTTGKISPAGALPGTYTITYTINAAGGCSVFATITTVLVSDPPTAIIQYPSMCSSDSDVPVVFNGTPGGTFSSDAGLNIDAVTGTIDATTSTPGNHTVKYSVAPFWPCPGFDATTTVTITKAPLSSIIYNPSSLCNVGTASAADVTITGDKGGTFTIEPSTGLTIDASTGKIYPAGATPGTYTITYTINATSVCALFATTTTVSVSAISTAIIQYPLMCSSDGDVPVTVTGVNGGTFSSGAGLVIDATTGTINASASTPGTYTVKYTIAPSAPCPAVETSTIVTITKAPSASIEYEPSSFCNTATTPAADVALTGDKGGTFTIEPSTGLTIDASTGKIYPAGATPGTFTITYTINASGVCALFQTTTTVSISTISTATIQYPLMCSSDGNVPVTISGIAGGTFSSDAGLVIDANTGTIDASASTPGIHTVKYSIASSFPCPVFETSTSVTITKAALASISYPAQLCNFSDPANTPVAVTLTGDNGGIFTITPSSGLTMDASTGKIYPAGATPGTYIITYTINASGACALFQTTATVIISSQPTAAIQYPPMCSSDGDVPVTITGAAGGMFSSDAGLMIDAITGTINTSASTPGTYIVKYITIPSAPCPAFETSTTISITRAPSASIEYDPSVFCNIAGASVADVILTGDNGGTFTIQPSTGLTIDASTGKIFPAGASVGTYTITYTINASGVCSLFQTTTTVTISSQPTAAIQYPPMCSSDGDVPVAITGATGGTFSSGAGLVIDANTGVINATASTPGTYTVKYTTVPSAPCPPFETSTTVTITRALSASIQYDPSNLCNGGSAPAVDVTLTGDKGGTFTIEPSTGLAINTATGKIFPAGATPRTYIITYTIDATGVCALFQTKTTVTVSSPSTAAIQYPPMCSSDGDVPVTITGAIGGTFSSDAGLVVDANTGTINAAASTPGTHTVKYIIAAAAPCPSFTASTTVIIVKAPTASIQYDPSDLCNGGTASAVDVTLSGDKGGIFTIEPSTGLAINTATGKIFPAGATPGAYTITYTINGSGVCALFQTTTTVTVSSQPAATIQYPPVCSSDSNVPATINGTQGGTFSSDAGLAIDASTGTINATTSTPGTHIIKYSIAPTQSCPGFDAGTTVIISKTPTASISYQPAELCNFNDPSNTPVAVTLTGDKGGFFSIEPSSGLTIDASTGKIYPAGATPGTYTITYTINASGACALFQTNTTVTVSNQSTASIQYPPMCSSDGDVPVAITGAIGGTFSSDAGLVIDANTGTINTIASTPGAHTVKYTIAPSAPCPAFQTSTTITITRAPLASIIYNPSSLCNMGSASAVDVTITGDKGGIFTIQPSTGLTIDASTGKIFPAGATPGTYTITYTINASGVCALFQTTTTVTISSQSTASIQYPPICSSDGDVPVTITGEIGGMFSSGAGLVIDANTGTISASASIPGTYTVKYTIAASLPCPAFETSATVTIVKAPAASIQYDPFNLCNGGASPAVDVILTGDKGGTFTIEPSAGLAINAATGKIFPAGATPGTYTITYTINASGPCALFQTTTTVIVSSQATATIQYPPMCSSDGDVPVAITGESGGTFSSDAGLVIDAITGTINASVSTPGTHTVKYSLASSSSCPVFNTSTTVIITKAPSASISYKPAALCNLNNPSNTPVAVTLAGDKGGFFTIQPLTGLTIDAATGKIFPTGATPGTYTITYTINASGVCALFQTTTTVIISGQPTAAIQYPPMCSTDGEVPVAITGANGGTFSSDAGLMIDANTGTINASASTPGSHTVKYIIASLSPCPDFETSTKVTIIKAPSASIEYNPASFCNTGSASAVDVTITGDKGGTFSIQPSTGLKIDAATGEIYPANATPGNYTITYTINATGPCALFQTTTIVTISSQPTATIQYPPMCSSDGDVPVAITGAIGGTFSSDAGLAIDPITGTINTNASSPGAHTVKYTTIPSVPCPAFETSTKITITKAPSAFIEYNPASFCNIAGAPAADVVLAGDKGGTFSIQPSTGLKIDAATGEIYPANATQGTYTITYTINATGPCALFQTTTIVTISSQPTASIQYPPMCSSDGDVPVAITGAIGGTFSSDAGLTIDLITGTINASASTPGTHTVKYTTVPSAPCPAFETSTKITITKAPLASIQYNPSDLCNGATASAVDVILSGDKGGAFTIQPSMGLAINAATGKIFPAGATPGTYTITYTINASGACALFQTTTTVTVSNQPTASIQYPPMCSSDGDVPVNFTGSVGGIFSSAAGLIIDANTGTINALASIPGTYIVKYTIASSLSCPGFEASTTVVITKAPSASISYQPAELCNFNNPSNTPVEVTISGDKGGIFTIEPSAGLTIDASTGKIFPAGATPGNYTITYTINASGTCALFQTTTTVSIGSQSTAAIQYPPMCSSDGDVPVIITGASGGTFSSDAGMMIDANTGTINTAASTPGTHIVKYTIAASAPCPDFETSVVVKITKAPLASIEYDPSGFCNTVNAPSVDVTLTGDKGGAFTIQPSTGLTIDDATGEIFPAGAKPGTYTITYTINASGVCALFQTTTTVTIGNQPTAAIQYPPVCSSDGDVPVIITGVKGGTFSSDAGLVIDAITGTINATTSTSGAHIVKYTIAASLPCPAFETSATVTITKAPSASIQYDPSGFCNIAGGPSVDVTLTGDKGGTFTIQPSTGLVIDDATGKIFPSNATPGTYIITYTINASGACALFKTTTTVTISSQPTANIQYPLICSFDGDVPVTITGTIGGTFSSDAGLIIDAITGTINASTSMPGTHTVKYTLASSSPCPAFETSTTVKITKAPAASIKYDPSGFCNTGNASAADVILTGDKGGIFTIQPSGLTIDASTGKISPAGANPGTYTITYTINAAGACALFRTTTTVSINTISTATIQYPPMCSSDGDVPVIINGVRSGLFSSDSGLVIDTTTGIINATTSIPGTHIVKYTIAASWPCPAFETSATVKITKAPLAAISYLPAELCNFNDPFNTPVGVTITGDKGGTFTIQPSTGLTIDNATGKIFPAGATPGTYTITYTINASGTCALFKTTTTVSITGQPTATIQYPPICTSDGEVSVTINGVSGGTFSSDTGLVVDAITGVINAPASIAGTHIVKYIIAPSLPCPAFETSTTVTITKTPLASISYQPAELCNLNDPSNTPIAVTIVGDKGGTFTIQPSTGLTIDAATGKIFPAGAKQGTYAITYTINAAGVCALFQTTTTVLVSSPSAAVIQYPVICSSDSNVAVAISGFIGGTFSSDPGLMIDTTTGTINATASVPGTHTVKYTIAASWPCPAIITSTIVTITKAPSAIINYPAELCNFSDPSNTPVAVTLTGDKGGIFSVQPSTGLSVNAYSGVISPAGAKPGIYAITYSLKGGGGCKDFTTSTTVSVSSPSVATIKYPGSPFCGASSDLVPIMLTGTTGGSFTSSAGLSIDTATGAINPSLSKPGVYTVTYTIAPSLPCPDYKAETQVEITESPVIIFADSSQTVCSGGTAVFKPASTVPDAVYRWSIEGTLPDGISGITSGTVRGPDASINLSFINTGSISSTITINVVPTNPAQNNCDGNPATLTLTINPIPAALNPDTVEFCMGSPATALTAIHDADNTVKWYDANYNPLSEAPVINTSNVGQFIFYATQVSSTGCESPMAKFVAIVHPIAKIISSSHIDPALCGVPSGSITLQVADLNDNRLPNIPLVIHYTKSRTPFTIKRTTDAAGKIVVSLSAGIYSEIFVETYGCTSQKLPDVLVLRDLTAPAQPIAGYDGPLCSESTLRLSASTQSNSQQGPISYVWSGPAFGDKEDTTQNTVITFPSASTRFSGTYVVYALQNSCISPAVTFPVAIRQAPIKPVINTKTPLCVGDDLNLQAISSIPGNHVLNFTWNGPGRGFPVNAPSAGIKNVQVSDGGIYTVSITSPETGCTVSMDTLIQISGNPIVKLADDSLNVATGSVFRLIPTIVNASEPGIMPISKYEWAPMQNLDCNDALCSAPMVTIKNDICYSVKATNMYGCSGSDTLCFSTFCKNAQVFIPNAFTPHGLAENSKFMVRASGIASIKSFRVFTRWGRVVFEKNNFAPNDPAYGWDGMISGKPADIGVYVYTVEVVCENGTPYFYKGNVTLLK